MLKLILRRVLVAIPTLILVSMIVFMLQKILPGDPVLTLAGEERDPAVLDYLRDKYRLNDPLPMQYAAWAGRCCRATWASRCAPTCPSPR